MKHAHLLALALATSLPALAHNHGGGHDNHAPAMHMAQSGAPTPTRAEVRKVDKAARKITLRHERIENLDMDGMTMVFQVQDPALLDKVKAGDQVQFTVDKIKGAYTVLTLEPLRP